MSAMRGLPIARKVDYHEIFLQSRKLSIEAVFQAKLGWLICQTFSRVGTPELRSDQLNAAIGDRNSHLAVWFPNEEISILSAS